MKMEMQNKFTSEGGFDRLSELPESIRLHIISFLKTNEAVRTSILSSIWRSLHVFLPNLDLSSHDRLYVTYPMDTFFCKGNDDASRAKRESYIRIRKAFYGFHDRVFASISKLDKIKLCVPGFDQESISRLDHWLDGAVRRGVKELALEISGFGLYRGVGYSVPKNVITANSILKLKLERCELSLSSKMNTVLPCLRELSLEGVVLNEVFMGSLLNCCLNLETLILKYCEGLVKLEIIGLLKLKEVTLALDLKAIKIDAPNLLEFLYDGYRGDDKCPIDLKGCENLKHLELTSSHLDDSDLDNILENLPLLEKLFLQRCDNLAYVEIYNQNLVNLGFHACRELVKVRVTTPNLKYFIYIGGDPISFVFQGPALKLLDASIHLSIGLRDQWFKKLIKLLPKLGHSENLTLKVATEKDVIIPYTVRGLCRAALHDVKHLVIDFGLPWLKFPVEVVASLLWLAPCPESLTISNRAYSVRKSLKFSYEGMKKCGCWKSLSINCWRHSLKTVWIENIGTVEDDSKLVSFFEKNRIDGEVECFTKNVMSEY